MGPKKPMDIVYRMDVDTSLYRLSVDQIREQQELINEHHVGQYEFLHRCLWTCWPKGTVLRYRIGGTVQRGTLDDISVSAWRIPPIQVILLNCETGEREWVPLEKVEGSEEGA